MRARALFAGLALALAVAGPAGAKGAIAEANISGPGLGGGSGSVGGGMRIDAPAADGMWDSGILDEEKEASVSKLGLAPADLGPRYLVTYRFDFGPGTEDNLIRQDLYPYAKAGPVTYTPPGQELAGEGMTPVLMTPIASGWFQTTPGFFEYLVSKGLPESNPVAAAADSPAQDPAGRTVPATDSAPWGWILLGLAGLAAVLSLATPRVRQRVLAVARANH